MPDVIASSLAGTGSAVAWAFALVLTAGILLTLAHAWKRAVAGSFLRRGWWLLGVAGSLQASTSSLGGTSAASRALVGLGVAVAVLAALLGAARRRRVGALREHASEAVLAGAVVALLVGTLAAETGLALGLGLVALWAQVGALWLVWLGPPAARPPGNSLRLALGASLLPIAGLQTFSLVGGVGRPGPWVTALTVIAVSLWMWVLLHPAVLAPMPHMAQREQALTGPQVGLTVSGVLLGPLVLVAWELTGAQGPTAPLAVGAGALALLAVLHLLLLVADRGRQAWRAQHDALTGLPTEPLFEDRLRQAIAGARRSGREIGVAFLDLDGFKVVNDSHGHEAGDLVLEEVSRRLRAHLRAQDTVARRSGDEFLVLLPDVAGPDAVELVVQRLLDAVDEPVVVGGQPARVGASIGVAMWPRDGLEAQELIGNADAAMYDAKAAGRGQMRWHRPATATRARLRLTLGQQLKAALAADELEVAYEPLVDLRDGSVEALAAHARWHHPRLGLLTPSAFLPAAAASGLSHLLDLHVLGLVCRRMARWERAGYLAIPAVVELSDAHVVRGDLEEQVLAVVSASGLSPWWLTLSVSEDGLRRGGQALARAVSGWAECGIRVVVRDFGSSDVGIARLSHVRISGLELSPHLVQRIRGVELPVVEAATLLADGLHLDVTGAGVDEQEQAEVLRTRGCPVARGPALAPILDADTLEARLHALSAEQAHDPGAVLVAALGAPSEESGTEPAGIAEVLAAALRDEHGLSEDALADALQQVGRAPGDRRSFDA